MFSVSYAQLNFHLSDDTALVKDSIYLLGSQTDISQDIQSALKQMMRWLMDVTTSQLNDFIAGNLYGVPPIPEGMKHCPLTNLLGENVFVTMTSTASPLFSSP